jgi:hypothetical protein
MTCGCITDGTVTQEQVDVASELLYILSGLQFAGNCERVVRPTKRYLRNDGPITWQSSVDVTEQFRYDRSWGACGCTWAGGVQDLGCPRLSMIGLGAYPIKEVTSVLVDGAVVPPSEYQVFDYRWLVNLTDVGWPCCQNLRLPSTEVGTFEVTHEFGNFPPASGVYAANKLSCELALACENSSACRLPRRVQSITRQGVSAVLVDPFDFLDRGRTGIIEVDMFLQAVNPGGITQEAVFVTPDVMQPIVEITGTEGS